MKPIWIVDDDESIRWVLEKALARENLATRSFSNVRDAVAALEVLVEGTLVVEAHLHRHLGRRSATAQMPTGGTQPDLR